MTECSDATGTRLIFPGLHGLYGRGDAIAYALLRAGFGVAMLTHGLPKLLGTPHGSMTDALGGATRLIGTGLGLPFAPQLAILITALETIGALMLTVGLFTRPVAALFAVQMLVICFALRANFAWIDRGYEYPLILGLIALLFCFRGGGEWSVDRRLRREL